MGSFNSDYIIYIREQDGSRTMFSAGELRDRLYHCIGDSSTADDITLAVEYSLLNRGDRSGDLVFDRGETDAAVVRLLEDTGFPDAAAEYRNGVYFEEEEVSTGSAELLTILRRHTGCSESHFEQVCRDVQMAAEKTGIKSASPHLYVELARYFSKQRRAEKLPELPELPEFSVADLEDIDALLSETAEKLKAAGVFEAECVTAIFPCIKFHVQMEKFSEYYDVSSPVTELLVYPAATEVSAALEECREKLRMKSGGTDSKLPCTLVIHDLRRFVRDAFDCTDDLAIDQLSCELGEIFTSYPGKNLFKLDFD